jgi:hypothetical protein
MWLDMETPIIQSRSQHDHIRGDRKWLIELVTIAAALTTVFTVCSAFALGLPDAPLGKADRRAERAVAVLSKMTDADSLAAAGVMSTDNHGEQTLSLLVRATAAAPDRADLVWLQALRCAQLPACDPLPIERRLRELDPTNGAGWWGPLARAGAGHDSEVTDVALAAIGHSDRVDIYWTTLIAHLSMAVAKTRKMSPEESEVAVIGYLAAEALPPYQYISNSCKGDRLQQPGVTEVCRGVAKALQNGDTYVTEMIGVAIAKRVWPEDSPEWKAAAEERRVYDYRSKLYSKLEQRALTHPGEYLALCTQNRREQDLFAAQLTAAGYDPNPPAQ